jgi:filamentous hemagglutinin family protein
MKRYLFTSALHSLSAVVSAGMLSCIDAGEASANPQGGMVHAGAAAIRGQGTSALQIDQVSDRAVIDWQSFDIAPGESTRFQRPSVSSLILNRIHDQNPSQIMGHLSANGQVMLVNLNGMVFGHDARVDVAGLVATSADISDAAFMHGRTLSFDHPGNPGAAIVNHGSISVKDAGLAARVAPGVVNDGVITAKAGRVTLGAGDTVTLDLYGDGLVSVAASGKMTGVTHTGSIVAPGGSVQLAAADAVQVMDGAVNMTGLIDVSGVETQGGAITLHAGNGTAHVGGTLRADSRGAQGGRIQITGEHIRVGAGAVVTASGSTGGGEIKIGGDYQGGGTLPHAKTTVIAEGARIDASATGRGDGGRVIVWSDEKTDFAGLIHVTGGLLGGDGGFAETSSKDVLIARGLVDASAPRGRGGEWLLDPNNITINTTADTNVSGSPDFVTTNDKAVVTVASILAALDAGTNVSVTTGTAGGNSQSGDITVASAIGKTAGGDATLTLKARNTITVNANISSTSNKLHVTLWSDSDNSGLGGITITNAAITTNGGNVTMGGGADPTANPARGTSTFGVQLNNGDISTGAGNISIRGRGEPGGASNIGVYVLGGSVLQTTSGDISLIGTGAALPITIMASG